MDDQTKRDVKEGANDWINIQEIIRESFITLNGIVEAQQGKMDDLRRDIARLEQETRAKTNEKAKLEEKQQIFRDRQAVLENSVIEMQNAADAALSANSAYNVDSIVESLMQRLYMNPTSTATTDRLRRIETKLTLLEEAAEPLLSSDSTAELNTRMTDIEQTISGVSDLLKQQAKSIDPVKVHQALMRKVDVTTLERQLDELRRAIGRKVDRAEFQARVENLG
ncbi:hypothetical protein J8273_3936 [Carpediemonas membranifera]|uniref:Uncharacterized protein n=1 Tax=Carpediemonas membranifera TaxID=201153 RepID=A0A8J6BC45_9EUKA|nr:hypothetical protein J8273_3936 [Carpediemonas membranifera]|eukprot:KAG9394302.1 hypothetical protein J8273_3936 [Carpediemonas membranifera]